MDVEGQSSESRPNRKQAVVPPIMIHSDTPCPATPIPYTASQGCMLPQISPHRSVISGGQPVEMPYNCTQPPAWSNDNHFKHPSDIFPLKTEPGVFGQQPVCASAQLQKSRFPPSHLSPLPGSNHSIHHLQLPNGSYTSQSPTFSDVSSIRLTPHSPFSRLSFSDAPGQKHGAVKGRQFHPQRTSLPPLSASYLSASNTDLDEANPSYLIPSPNSLSPYLGSGIDIPSIISPLNSANHLSRKRALSTSPLSDFLDFNSLIRTSPNSLVAVINNSNPISPNPTGSIGHLVGQPSPAPPTLQYKIQQRKTSIEHNHNSDGTTNTTITNQITFSDRPHQLKYNMVPKDLAMQSSEPMEFDQHCSKNAHLQPLQMEPHICLWDGCRQNFDDLDDLVQHIENAHIEKGKLDDFTCMWQSCPRKRKPFNARYKLLIHMRIHSGEKPNKCTVSEAVINLQIMNNTTIHLMITKLLLLCGL